MTATNTVPELDVEMIFKLIKWAERDEQFLKEFASWGAWNQGLWGAIAKEDVETALGERVTDPEDITDEEMNELRNGACRTAYCMAGQTVVQHNYRLIYDEDGEDTIGGEVLPNFSASYCIEQEFAGTKVVKGREVPIYRDVEDAEPESIEAVARDMLGITSEEQGRFFNGSNELDDLRAFANGMCARRGLPLLFPNDDVYDFD